ncbi:MAG: AbrB/MazE/SpoVT family DNA-binding domain-containing protein [Deltaproteobacteria bacterium]|nr:AbrB/MazE/SpoVT family DNA-binding domain-containing protein [Deltaproteobacteria bacterium]
MPLVKVRRHHQITLPQEIRLKLGVGEGDLIEMVVENGRIVGQPVRVVPELPAENDFSITDLNAGSFAFDFLKDEPDIYTENDVKKRYV